MYRNSAGRNKTDQLIEMFSIADKTKTLTVKHIHLLQQCSVNILSAINICFTFDYWFDDTTAGYESF